MLNAAKHTHHDNGGAARNWKVLSISPPLRGAEALGDMLPENQLGGRG